MHERTCVEMVCGGGDVPLVDVVLFFVCKALAPLFWKDR